MTIIKSKESLRSSENTKYEDGFNEYNKKY